MKNIYTVLTVKKECDKSKTVDRPSRKEGWKQKKRGWAEGEMKLLRRMELVR